jgi:uncharacterized protein with PIN domain
LLTPLVSDVPLKRHEAIRTVERMGWPEPLRSRCFDCPGHLVYLPKQLKNELRNREMLRKFNGHNVPELCSQYGITKTHFYRLLKRDRARRAAVFRKK